MSHPYAQYIETKAAEYYSRQAHEPHCETLQPYKVPTNERTGETYDVYIIQHCDCWLLINFDKLTLSRKLDAMRHLSHRFGLHSAACSRLKTEKITYRNKPETLHFACDCWLSVPMVPDRPEKACPVCDKALFYAPRAPEDTAKMACSDLNCINAHGIVQWFPVDTRPEPPVEYVHQPEEQRKETPMTKPQILSDSTRAKSYASAFSAAQNEINDFLAPLAREYFYFMSELHPNGWDKRDINADQFVETGDNTFYLTGEEVYEYSEYYTPSLSLPFDFVEDPEAFKVKARAEKAAQEEKAQTKKKADAAERVVRLKAQLARAEAEAAAAETQKDEIKLTATRIKAKELRTQYMEQG